MASPCRNCPSHDVENQHYGSSKMVAPAGYSSGENMARYILGTSQVRGCDGSEEQQAGFGAAERLAQCTTGRCTLVLPTLLPGAMMSDADVRCELGWYLFLCWVCDLRHEWSLLETSSRMATTIAVLDVNNHSCVGCQQPQLCWMSTTIALLDVNNHSCVGAKCQQPQLCWMSTAIAVLDVNNHSSVGCQEPQPCCQPEPCS